VPAIEQDARSDLRLGGATRVAGDAARPSSLHTQQRRGLDRSVLVSTRDLTLAQVDRFTMRTFRDQRKHVRVRSERRHRTRRLVRRELGRPTRVRLGEGRVTEA
jgi:hypothetical protein